MMAFLELAENIGWVVDSIIAVRRKPNCSCLPMEEPYVKGNNTLIENHIVTVQDIRSL